MYTTPKLFIPHQHYVYYGNIMQATKTLCILHSQVYYDNIMFTTPTLCMVQRNHVYMRQLYVYYANNYV